MDLNTENVPSLVPPLRTEPDQDARKAVAASRAAINAVLRNKSIRELMQQRFPIDTRDAEPSLAIHAADEFSFRFARIRSRSDTIML